MTKTSFALTSNLETALATVHPSWQATLVQGLGKMDSSFLQALDSSSLATTSSWLPGYPSLFKAFSIAREDVRYVLIGESPYPRVESANGYAFWDNAVKTLWSDAGFSKAVNRATSLRNFLKMLLVAEGRLTSDDTSQPAIASLSKQDLIVTAEQLFQGLINKGFLLLNASLSLNVQGYKVIQEARAWHPVIEATLASLKELPTPPALILFGNIAKAFDTEQYGAFPKLIAEHPYNLSFINNPLVIDFFTPHHLLLKE